MRGTGLKQCKDYDACGVAGEDRVERQRPLRRPGRNDGVAVIWLASRAGTPTGTLRQGKGSGSEHSPQNNIKTSKSKPRSGDMMMDFIWSYWVAFMPKRKKQIEKPQKGPEPTGVET